MYMYIYLYNVTRCKHEYSYVHVNASWEGKYYQQRSLFTCNFHVTCTQNYLISEIAYWATFNV